MVSDYDIFCGVPGHYDSICYSTYGIIFSNYLPLSSSPALVMSSTTLRLCRIVRHPRFMQQHCRRCHRCNPILIPTITGAPLIPANPGVMLGVLDDGTGWTQPSIPTRVMGATRGGGRPGSAARGRRPMGRIGHTPPCQRGRHRSLPPCCKPSDQPRDAARQEECLDLDEKSLTTFCRYDGRAKRIARVHHNGFYET